MGTKKAPGTPGTVSKNRYDKLRDRYRLLLYFAQSFEHATRLNTSGDLTGIAKVLVEEIRDCGYLDEDLKGAIKGKKEYLQKCGLA